MTPRSHHLYSIGDRHRSGLRAALACLIIVVVLLCTACHSSGDSQNPADAVRIDWRDLFGLNPVTGDMSPNLRSLLKQTVRIPGFVVPLDDGLTEASTFLLVPNFGACIHLPAPEANQMVLVEMAEDRSVEFDFWKNEPIWVIGDLSASAVDSPWGNVGFSMVGLDSMSFSEGLTDGEHW